MNSVYDMTREQFLKELNTKCRPADILKWAPEIYAYLSGLFTENCSDSVLREWSFQWASEKLKVDYDVLYNAWLK
jgi:hypothetical protein